MNTLSRRNVLFTGLGLASAGALSACGAKNTPAAAPAAPRTLTAKPRQKVRLRVVNASSDTIFKPADSARLPGRKPDTTLDVALNGQMKPYAWGLNGKRFGEDTPLALSRGQRVRLRMTNMTMMAHPMHIHGHTWVLPGSDGLRKDTVLIRPMETVEADLQADNPVTWMLHCHNIYHAELGMMTTLRY